MFSVLGDQWRDKANPACSDVTQERTVHVDQYSGQVIAQYGWDDYTAAANSTGIALVRQEGARRPAEPAVPSATTA